MPSDLERRSLKGKNEHVRFYSKLTVLSERSAVVSIMFIKRVNIVISPSFPEFLLDNSLSCNFPKIFLLFSPASFHYLKNRNPKKCLTRPSRHVPSHRKNVDYHRKTYTLEDKESNKGFFQPQKLLLTSIK